MKKPSDLLERQKRNRTRWLQKGKKKRDDDIENLDEAIEEKVSLSDEEGHESPEPEGEDLLENMEKYN